MTGMTMSLSSAMSASACQAIYTKGSEVAMKVKISAITATNATLDKALDLGKRLAPEGDMIAALDVARMALIEGRVRQYVEREPGAPGAWKIDDDAALKAIRAKWAEHPGWQLSQVMRVVFPNAPASDFKRWRERIKESFR
jgi:hypothetical protein